MNDVTTKTGQVHERAVAARRAGRALARLDGVRRGALLRDLAAALEDAVTRTRLHEANARDLQAAREAEAKGELGSALVKRLGLSDAKLDALAHGLRQLADAPELVGARDVHRELDDGLVLERRACPLGVLGIVFESRPDAVPQITGLALKSGNAVLLKGGREAAESNAALVGVIHTVLKAHDVDPEAVVLLQDRAAFREMLDLEGIVDMVIARGSGEFVKMVQGATSIPVMGHSEGVCHVYLHADARAEMAASVCEDAKCSYPAACNTMETLLWHPDAGEALDAALARLKARGVTLRGDAATVARHADLEPAREDDWDAEYCALELSIAQVPSLDAALEHIEAHGSKHTEAILTGDRGAAERFLAHVDAASVFHNASTRFADGYRYGLGAEVGISTGKLHARGPVGVDGLLTTRWILRGSGQSSTEYGADGRSYTHRDLDSDDS